MPEYIQATINESCGIEMYQHIHWARSNKTAPTTGTAYRVPVMSLVQCLSKHSLQFM